MKIEVKKVNLSKIKLNPDNPRQITKAQLDRLVKSITEFPEMMELREIVVDDTMTILGGNMRFRALKEAGEKEAIAKIATGLTPEQKREFIIKDNGTNWGEWDMDALGNLWSDLPLTEWGIDLPEDWLNGGGNETTGLTDPDTVPEVPKVAITKPGDIWLCGKHRVMAGDSTKAEDVERLMDGKKADAIIADPPYGMDLDTDYSKLTSDKSFHAGKKHKAVIGDDKPFDAGFMIGMAPEVILFGGDYYVDTLPNYGKDGSWMVWDKRASESQDKGFGSNFELLWSKVQNKRWMLRHNWFGFFTGGEKREYDHPTQKPVSLFVAVMELITGQLILDTYAGSGTTLIAAEQTGRTAVLMEIDPLYVDVIVKRWEDYTGETAILEDK